MSTVAEIESAIERLPQAELSELAKWFEEYQQMVGASGEMFAMYGLSSKWKSTNAWGNLTALQQFEQLKNGGATFGVAVDPGNCGGFIVRDLNEAIYELIHG